MSKSDIEYNFDLMGFGLNAAMASLKEPTNLKLAFWADKTPQGADFWAPAIFNNKHTPETLAALKVMIMYACLRPERERRKKARAQQILIALTAITTVAAVCLTALTLVFIGAVS